MVTILFFGNILEVMAEEQMVAILFTGNILEVMTEEVYKQNFTDTYVFIKSKKELEKER